MPLDYKFCSAAITALAEKTFKLVITYSYYGLYKFSHTYVFSTMQDCINRLAFERCMSGMLTVKALNGDLVEINPPGG